MGWFTSDSGLVVGITEYNVYRSKNRPSVVLMLVHRLRRWSNIETTLAATSCHHDEVAGV